MIVIDTSILIDRLFEKDEKRRSLAAEFLELIKGLRAFAPKILLIEFISVGTRLGMKISKEDALKLAEDIILVSENILFEEALKVAENVHPRAADAYFIATAKLTNSILITNDRRMAENAKRYGVEAYYLVDEFHKVAERIKKLSGTP